MPTKVKVKMVKYELNKNEFTKILVESGAFSRDAGELIYACLEERERETGEETELDIPMLRGEYTEYETLEEIVRDEDIKEEYEEHIQNDMDITGEDTVQEETKIEFINEITGKEITPLSNGNYLMEEK